MRSEGGVEGDLKESAQWADETSGRSRFRSLEVKMVDGKKQVVMHSFSGKERNKLFLNSNASEFKDVSLLSGADAIADGRTFGLFDYNHDGWQDIALGNVNEPHLQIFHNNHQRLPDASNGFVAIRLVGGNKTTEPSKQFSSRDGYGAKVTVLTGEKILLRDLKCGEGFSSQNSTTMIIGLGNSKGAESIVVRWPSGHEQSLENADSGSLITFFENPADCPDPAGFTTSVYATEIASETAKSAEIANRDEGQFLYEDPSLRNDNAKLRVMFSMATWCESCRSKADQIARLNEHFAGKNVEFYGIPVDPADTSEKLADYEKNWETPYKLLRSLGPEDKSAVSQYFAKNLNSQALPGTIFTDKAGHPVFHKLGVPTISDIEKWLEKLDK